MTTRVTYSVNYLYPGSLFPESITKTISDDTLDAVLASDPGPDAYYKNTPCYGAVVKKNVSERAVFDDGSETWIHKSSNTIKRYLWGEFFSSEAIKAMEGESTLYRNSLYNGILNGAIKCRSGNWQTVEPHTVLVTENGRTISFE